jgi:hypothetical protein
MAKFQVTIKKTQTMDVIVDAAEKLDACILAKHKAKNREWDSTVEYEIVNIESGI